MKISEAIEQLTKIKRRFGDIDLVYILHDQCADVTAINGYAGSPDKRLDWAWSGPVAIVDMDPN